MNATGYAEKFNGLVLEWARAKFEEELATDFARARSFDSTLNREIFSVLRRQPAQNLKILAKVLPLGVFWERPDDIKRRRELPAEEGRAVETLRIEFDQESRNQFDERVKYLARRSDDAVKEQFNLACRKGNEMVKEIALQSNAELARAGRGEWGIIFKKNGLRIPVSLNLARHMELGYTLSVSNLTSSRSFRFHDTYLGVLGFGMGQWDVETFDRFPEKLVRAAEFAHWHVQEYEKLLEKVDYLKSK